MALGLGVLLVGCGKSGGSGAAISAVSAEEQLIEQGRRQARMCVGCHGPEGRSRVQSYPSLAGLESTYVAEQLHAFRNGERDNPMMSSVARNLDGETITALSAYYASREALDE